jgi:hypothetical protein
MKNCINGSGMGLEGRIKNSKDFKERWMEGDYSLRMQIKGGENKQHI